MGARNSTTREVKLRAYIVKNCERPWSNGARLWSNGARMWSNGARVWSNGARLWSTGTVIVNEHGHIMAKIFSVHQRPETIFRVSFVDQQKN